MADDPLTPFDAVLVHSFGGPEGPDEVLPFLRRVTGGKGIPDERLREVGQHYDLFGGRSPINDLGRALVADLADELRTRGSDIPVVLGNRHSDPFVADVLDELVEGSEGRVRRVLVVRTSAWRSYSSCRAYREDLAASLSDRDLDDRLEVAIVRPYAEHPGFAATNAELVTAALQGALADDPDPRLLFVTHSIPESMDLTSGPGDDEERAYSRGHVALAAAICEAAGERLGREVDGELVFCSRSGPPHMPWLEPDIDDRIRELAGEGVRTVVVAPIGFVSDHMEVVYDLAAEHGVRLIRVPTAGSDPAFVAGLADLLAERAAEHRGDVVAPQTWGGLTASPSICPSGCCPNLRDPRPAVGERA
jgi:ferrochelatase